MPSSARDQLGMDERVIDDRELEEALEQRQDALEEMRPAAAAYKGADKAAKAIIERVVPTGSIVRVGRFRVEAKPTEARHIEFDTAPGSRVSIAASDE